MFSKRTQWDQELNDLHQVLDALKSSGTDVIDGTESNPTRCGFDYPPYWVNALADPLNMSYDPQSAGILSAREAVGKFCAFDPLQVLLTASTSESYSFLFRLLLDPKDHVLVPSPSYPLFQFLLELNDAHYDYYPLKYDNAWGIDFDALEKLVRPRTRAIVLVNPNNPTGSYLKKEELFLLNMFCKKHNLVIISDEVFMDYRLQEGAFPTLKGNSDVLTFVLGGLSKALALPQMKLGWILTSGPQQPVQEALMRLEIIADTYLSVNTPVQHAVAGWLADAKNIQRQIIERVKTNLSALTAAGLKVLPVEGGWYAVISMPHLKEEEFVLELLSKHHILIHPGFFFDFPETGYVVVSLLPKTEHFDKMVRILRHPIKSQVLKTK